MEATQTAAACQLSLFDPPPPPRRLPRPSWHRTSPLSRKARNDARPREGSRAAIVLTAVSVRGEHGLTRDELAEQTGIPLQSLCGIVRRLLDDRLLVETDATRPTRTGSAAAVLMAVELSTGEG